jgi:nicotinamidase-related amidase
LAYSPSAHGIFTTSPQSAAYLLHHGLRKEQGKNAGAAAAGKQQSVAAQSAPATLLNSRSFAPAEAKGGRDIQAATTAVVFIEYQNEFTSEGGKLYGAVKEVMDANDMLKKSATVAKAVRKAGGKVFHVPISFAKDGSDNPNKGLGILAGCAKDELFTAGTWNAEFCEAMKPEVGDVVVVGKKGLDAFPGTDLEAQLKVHGIETVALAGFLTNCCVESTMRTACEKGFNVVTVTDCTAATSKEGQAGAAEGTFGMFSLPMTAAAFQEKLAGVAGEDAAAAATTPVAQQASSVAEPKIEGAEDVAKFCGCVSP